MPATYYLDNVAINWMRGVTVASPAGLFLAALTAAPSFKIPTMTEVANTYGYARVAVAFAAPVNGVAINDAPVFFPLATGGWGTITHLAIVDSGAYGGGNVLWILTLTDPLAIAYGQQLSFDTTSFRVEVTAD